ncbi:hypothetical protein D9619_012499 [Psilocybe cf. subviscida]|uniref:Uncharacterized protein n=1 Tax=Psilocybe cf. subviscida TaxID=2480587 RepID=A0A8H5B864_9AGAR|nr:hypothetical protein D9619_012499 [Psilocybe cf. subviscida]
MSSSISDMPQQAASTQSENSTFSLSDPSLDVITVAPDSVPFLNRWEHGADTEYYEREYSGLEVFWHLTAGLFVSPNVTYLPGIIPNPNGPADFRNRSIPNMLTDSSIYLAFRPRYVQNTGDLFGRLNISREALKQLIVNVPDLKFMLNPNVIARWARLEDALIDVSTTLISAAPSLPNLVYPKFPWEFGYRDPHRHKEQALHCAVRARDAFVELAALVSFSISLHMSGTDPASVFKVYQARSQFKVLYPWFDLLSNSYVFNFAPNFRVGGFINPYTSRWMGYIGNFTRLEVPIWISWGNFYHMTSPFDAAAHRYLPPDEQIQSAKSRTEVSHTLTVPFLPASARPPPSARYSNYYHPPSAASARPPPLAGSSNYPHPPSATSASFPPVSHFNDNDDPMGAEPTASPQRQTSNSPVRDSPHSPSPQPESRPLEPLVTSEEDGSRKEKALAALEEHFRRQERGRELRLEGELPREKLQRESWELHAKTVMKYTSKSPVYEWRELPDGTYERVKLTSAELDAWSNYTRNQRRFIGHINTWELCPQLPEFSEEFPEATERYSGDDDSDYSKDDDIPAPRVARGELYTDDIRGLTQTQTVDDASVNDTSVNDASVDNASASDTSTTLEVFNFADFVKYRFGYNIFSPVAWNGNNIPPSQKALNVSISKAKAALSFNKIPPGDDVEEAVLNLVKTLSNRTWTFRQLPAAYDHTNDGGVSLNSDMLQIIQVLDDESTQYLICKQGYVDKCPWGILVADTSSVLVVFRYRWTTVSAIARNFVTLGVRFHTVLAAEAAPIKPCDEPVRGLGTRPNGYEPTQDDYSEYLRRRKDLLTGPKGRAALMHGGIIARIARDVLDVHATVLDGPSEKAVTVGRYRRFNLYDDALTENNTNIICGVYYVDVESSTGKQVSETADFASGTKAHMSYWPKDTTWDVSSGFLRAEWSEKAEAFYQKRSARLLATFELLNASAWRSALRVQNTLTKEIEVGAEHYQAGYLEDYYRRTRFAAERR